MQDKSKGTYVLKTKNDNFHDGKIDYDFNNINGFSTIKINKFLSEQGYVSVMPANDLIYNACLFGLASKQDMAAILALKMQDFNAIATMTMYFFASGLGAELGNSTQAEATEELN